MEKKNCGTTSKHAARNASNMNRILTWNELNLEREDYFSFDVILDKLLVQISVFVFSNFGFSCTNTTQKSQSRQKYFTDTLLNCDLTLLTTTTTTTTSRDQYHQCEC